MKRIIGVITLIGATLGLLLSLSGLIWGYGFIARTYDDWDVSLQASITSMENISATVQQTDTILEETVLGLMQINQALGKLGKTFDTTGPIIETFQQIAVNDVPDSLDIALTGLGSAVGVLRTVDNTLQALSEIEIDLPGPLPVVRFGIPYSPETPLYEPFETVSSNLSNVSTGLRSINVPLGETRDSVATISKDLGLISERIDTITGNLDSVRPSLIEFDESVQRLIERLQRTQGNIPRNEGWTDLIFTALLLWLALSQIGVLYYGYTLLQRPDKQISGA